MPHCDKTCICISGASPDTDNLGVSALFHSVAEGVFSHLPTANLRALSYTRRPSWSIDQDRTVELIDVLPTRNWFDPRHIGRIAWENRMGLTLSSRHQRLRDVDVFLDISGGDSFTDLYGSRRFHGTLARKSLAVQMGKSLILLPQTYGPFRSPDSRKRAAAIVRAADMAWARDAQSFSALRDLLGDCFDAKRHRTGVDVAFLLPTCSDNTFLSEPASNWLAESQSTEPTVGINVSGLLYHDPDSARSRYGFIADYNQLTFELVLNLVDRGARVVLIPHVVAPQGHFESDVHANQLLVDLLPQAARDRVELSPVFRDPRKVKAVISRCDWFCGTRMHSTIAALSQGVPTAAVAYSMKTQGVFETCGQGDHVADPRHSSTEEVVSRLLASFDGREAARASLAEHLPGVRRIAQEQMACVVDLARAHARTGAA